MCTCKGLCSCGHVASVNWYRPIQTVAGMPARVLATDIDNSTGRTIAVEFKPYQAKDSVLMLVKPDGTYDEQNSMDRIINVPERMVTAYIYFCGQKFTARMSLEKARRRGYHYND